MKDMKPVIKEIETKGIITKTDIPVCDYAVNPYIGCTHSCKYCYASFMKRFTGHGEEWGSFLDVKYWPTINNPEKYDGKELFFGTVTDPYNPQEETYARTRALLEQLRGSKVKLSIQTKSDLVLRDIDIIKTFPDARVGFSINTLDESFKDDMDNAVSIERRLEAMKKFYDEGIRTTCFISPIFPSITDIHAIIDRVRTQCNLIWLENLNLRGSYKGVILDYIRNNYPQLIPLYEDIYTNGNGMYWEALDAQLREYARIAGLPYIRDNDSIQQPFNAPPIIVNYFYHEKIKKSVKKAR